MTKFEKQMQKMTPAQRKKTTAAIGSMMGANVKKTGQNGQTGTKKNKR